MKRPIIEIPSSSFDTILNAFILLCQFLLIVIPIYFFGQLPEKIPIHFGFDGTPDNFGSKVTVFIVPLIALSISILLSKLVKVPHKFNYPVKIHEGNAFIQYSIATRMIRTLNAFITGSMLYITYSTIQSAINNKSGLGVNFVSIFIVVLLVIVGMPLIQSAKFK